MDGRDKIFSEQEAADVVLEAAKLQEAEPDGVDSYVPGIRLEELKRMAKELGVEERYLMKALERRGSFRPVQATRDATGFWSTPWKREFESVVDGELPPEHFDIVVEELSGTGGVAEGSTGTASTVGRLIQGTVAKGMGHGRLQVAGRHGRTRIRMTSDASMPILVGILPFTFIAMMAALIAVDKGGLSTAMGFGLFGLMSLAGFLVSKTTLAGAHRAMEEVFQRVVAKVDNENAMLRENLGAASSGVSESVPDELSARVGEE